LTFSFGTKGSRQTRSSSKGGGRNGDDGDYEPSGNGIGSVARTGPTLRSTGQRKGKQDKVVDLIDSSEDETETVVVSRDMMVHLLLPFGTSL